MSPRLSARKPVLHDDVVLDSSIMKTNVTLKLDSSLLREARVLAAEEGRSISGLLTDRLEAIVRERKAFDKARRRALATVPCCMRNSGCTLGSNCGESSALDIERSGRRETTG